MWLTVGLGLFLGDLLIPGGLVLGFFGAGALAVGLVGALTLIQDAWVEWLLFSGFSIVALLGCRPSLVRDVRRIDPSLQMDSLVGESAVAQEAIAVTLDVGIGVAQGEATLALLSCAGRVGYAMLGSVMELAEQLCHAALPRQILLPAAVGAAVAGTVDVVPVAPCPRRGGPEAGAILQVGDSRSPR